MKITARIRDGAARKVALDCRPFWGRPFTVYATLWRAQDGSFTWHLPSGRKCSQPMLDAIDQLDSIEIKAGPL